MRSQDSFIVTAFFIHVAKTYAFVMLLCSYSNFGRFSPLFIYNMLTFLLQKYIYLFLIVIDVRFMMTVMLTTCSTNPRSASRFSRLSVLHFNGNVLLEWELIQVSSPHFCTSWVQQVCKNRNCSRHTYKLLSGILLKNLLQSPVGMIDRGKRANFTAKDGNCSKELDSYLGHKNTISYFLNCKILLGKVHPLNDNS